MPNYNVNFSNVWQNLMPSNKRLTKYLAWGKVLLYPLQWLHSRLFLDYKEGTIYLDWNNYTAYTKGTFVRYTNKSIYYCIQDTIAGIDPLQVDYWYKTQDNFIGVTERMKYNSQIILFEYALNKWFGLAFLQPDGTIPVYTYTNDIDINSFLVSLNDNNSAYAVLSGSEALQFVGLSFIEPVNKNIIYITTNNIDVNSFLVSSDDINSSYSVYEGNEALQFVGDLYNNTNIYSFTIYYPIGLPATLGITDSILRQQITILANKLKISGTIYNINSY